MMRRSVVLHVSQILQIWSCTAKTIYVQLGSQYIEVVEVVFLCGYVMTSFMCVSIYVCMQI